MIREKNKSFVLWFTGLSAAGKSTIADAVYSELNNHGLKIQRLDGDVVRNELTSDLSFSPEDRDENIKRVGFLANMLSTNGVAVVASFIAPYKRHRQDLKDNVYNFIEVFVDAPLEVCMERDPKGLYKKAQAGEIELFTGLGDVYDRPDDPHIHLLSHELSVEDCRDKVIEYLLQENFIKNLSKQ